MEQEITDREKEEMIRQLENDMVSMKKKLRDIGIQKDNIAFLNELADIVGGEDERIRKIKGEAKVIQMALSNAYSNLSDKYESTLNLLNLLNRKTNTKED